MNRKRLRIILSISVVLLIAWIFINSLLPQTQSMTESEWVRGLLNKLFKGNKFVVTDYLHIRKTAHFVEFCILGIFSARLYSVYKNRYKFVNLYVLFTSCFLVGFLDETIQLFTDRTSQIKDVWLDFFGSLCGIMIFFAVYLSVGFFKNRSKN